MIESRFKDPECSWQRIIYVLGLLTLAVRKLTEWLSDDAIHFEILFVRSPTHEPLDDEATLLHTLLGEELEKELLRVDLVEAEEIEPMLVTFARQTLCHACTLGSPNSPSDLPIASSLELNGAVPDLQLDGQPVDCGEAGDSAWRTCAETLMRWWV